MDTLRRVYDVEPLAFFGNPQNYFKTCENVLKRAGFDQKLCPQIPSENDELSLKIEEISPQKLYFQRVIYGRTFVGFG